MINKHKPTLITLLFLFLLIPVSVIHAQSNVTVTLIAAIDSAMKNNSKIRQYNQVLLEKNMMQKASTGNFLPSIDVMGGYTYFSKNSEINMETVKESMDDVAGKYGAVIAKELGLSDEAQQIIYDKIVTSLGKLPAYNITIDQQNYPNLNIVATQPIYMGGKIIAGKRFADAEYNYADAELSKVKNEITKEVIERYFGVVLLQQVVKVREEVVKGMKHHERDAEKAIEIGVIPSHELLRAKVAVANAERDFIDDQNKLELALLSLKSSMGLPELFNIEVSDSMEFKLINEEVDVLKKEAVSQQPIFSMIEQKKTMVDQKHALEVSEFLPQIAAWGQYNAFNQDYPITLPPFMVGVQAHINLFHGFQKYNKLKATKYLKKQVEFADKYAHEQINLLVDKSWREVINKRERYLKMEPTVELAKKNLEINEKRFREGLSKSIDVIDARLLYEGAEVERLKSLYDYYIALSNLYLATGNSQKAVEILSSMSK
ncbi:MAG: TolC family protein [Chlorobi bacterium]|nr:TolC family protein [Chlorobiota bacterium]